MATLSISLALGLPTTGEAFARAPSMVDPSASTETGPTESTEATPAEAAPAEPLPTEAAPAGAAPTEPAPTEPAPTEPAPTEHPEPALSPAWPTLLTVQACPFAAPSLPQQADTALDATLLVKTTEGFGSAVLVSPDGFALTAAHVVGSSDAVSLVGHGGHALQGTVVRVDEPQDVALLKVEVSGASPCLLPIEARALVGSDVFILGSPAGEELSFSISKGIVSAYRSFGGGQFVQLDAALNPGNSGGPVVSAEGRVVGIASWKVSHVSMEGLAFAVPIDVALHALGVELGAASSADWASMKGRHDVAPVASLDLPRSTEASQVDPALLRKRRVRRGLIAWGATMLGSGVATIAITAGIYYRRDEMKQGTWAALQATNTVGWSVAIGGGAMLLAGLLIRTKPKQERAAMSLSPIGRGLVLHGRF